VHLTIRHFSFTKAQKTVSVGFGGGKDMEISLSGIITAILELQLYAGSATT
jgi:hypothetical protein